MNFKRFLFAAVSLVVTFAALAVPARPGRLNYTQPDGSTIELQLVGDEYGHFYLTDDNRMVVMNESGEYCFAETDANGSMKASSMLASNTAERTPAQAAFLRTIDQNTLRDAVAKRANSKRAKAKSRAEAPAQASTLSQTGIGLFPNTSFPHTGNGKGLVILVQYSDVSFNMSDPKTYFTNMLNQEGFSQDNATGSARDYFIASSNRAYTPTFDVLGPVTLPNTRAYYGGNDADGNDIAPEDMVVHACQQLNATVDFSNYDTDNDGYVDFVYVIYAGLGEAAGGSDDTVWPHSYDLYSTGKMYSLGKLDGKYVYKYACSAEQTINQSKRTINSGIGTFVHEFSHVMGLPDMYDTLYGEAYSRSLTPGTWSLMDQGSYNNNERTPPTYSIFERNAMGWADVHALESGKGETISLGHILTSNKGCMIPTSSNNEFFLLENRQRTGWDAYLPASGLLIWHIDYDETVWSNNKPNNTASRQRIDIEEANNTPSIPAGYTFPGSSKKTSFTDTTSPNMKTWSGASLNTPITNIKENNGIVTFDVCGGAIAVDSPTANVTGDDITCDNAFNLVLTPANADDEIHYEFIAENSSTYLEGIFNGPITISEQGLIEFWSERSGIVSDHKFITFYFKAATPVISPTSGSFSAMPEVSITSATEGAEIRYTIDGTAPTAESTLYTAPFTPANGDITIKALALKSGYTNSEVAQVEYTFVELHSGEVTYNLYNLWEQEGQSNWSTSYSSHTINSTEAKIQMTANHPASDQPITDYPVTKGSDLTITMNQGYAPVKGVYLKGCQWNDKAQTISLQYSTDGSRFTTIEGVESSEFALLCNDIPADTKAVRFKFSSSSNQIGLQKIIVSYGNNGEPIVIGNNNPDPDPDPNPDPNPDPDPEPNPDPDPNPNPDPQTGDGFTIVFVANSTDDNTPFSAKTHYESAVESGREYATYSTSSKAYKGADGLKLGSSSNPGSITLTVNDDYVGKVSSVIINAKQYNNDSSALKFNGKQGNNLTATFADYTWNLEDAELSEIKIETTSKRAYIHSITVVYTKSDDPEDPEEPEVAPAAPVFKYHEVAVDGNEITVNVLDDIEILSEEGTTVTVTEADNIDFDAEDNYALVTVLGPCSITATATRGELSTSATLTVNVNPIEDAIFTIGEDTTVAGTVEVEAGDNITVTAPVNASITSVVAEPEENAEAVEIDGTYLVSITGNCTITATVKKGNVTKTTSLEVTVAPGEEPDPEDPEDPQEPTVVEKHFTIVYVTAASDSSTDLTSTSYENAVEEGLDYASFSECSKVYDGKTGLKFSSSRVNGYIVLNFNEGYVKPVTKIELNAVASESGAELNVNTSNAQSISSSSLSTYTWEFDGSDMETLRIDATKRSYVKSITIFYNEATQPDPEDPTDPDVVESDPSSATFDFTVEENCYGMELQTSGSTYNNDGYVCKDLESNVYLTINNNGGNGSRWWKGANSNVLRLYKNATIEVNAPTGHHIVRILLEGVTKSHWTVDGTPYSDVQINGQEGWFEKGKTQYELALTLPSSKNNTDVQKIHVTIDKIGSGINSIGADNDDSVEYYNLQGIRVLNPTSGLYIRRMGTTVTKVMIR